MRVIDLIKSTEKTAFSFEVLPPLKGTGIEKLYQTIDALREFDPKYITEVNISIKNWEMDCINVNVFAVAREQ